MSSRLLQTTANAGCPISSAGAGGGRPLGRHVAPPHHSRPPSILVPNCSSWPRPTPSNLKDRNSVTFSKSFPPPSSSPSSSSAGGSHPHLLSFHRTSDSGFRHEDWPHLRYSRIYLDVTSGRGSQAGGGLPPTVGSGEAGGLRDLTGALRSLYKTLRSSSSEEEEEEEEEEGPRGAPLRIPLPRRKD